MVDFFPRASRDQNLEFSGQSAIKSGSFPDQSEVGFWSVWLEIELRHACVLYEDVCTRTAADGCSQHAGGKPHRCSLFRFAACICVTPKVQATLRYKLPVARLRCEGARSSRTPSPVPPPPSYLFPTPAKRPFLSLRFITTCTAHLSCPPVGEGRKHCLPKLPQSPPLPLRRPLGGERMV